MSIRDTHAFDAQIETTDAKFPFFLGWLKTGNLQITMPTALVEMTPQQAKAAAEWILKHPPGTTTCDCGEQCWATS